VNRAITAGALVLLSLLPASVAVAQAHSPAPAPASKETSVTTKARGTFDVKLNPQVTEGYDEEGTLGRLTIDKQIHGDLEATSKGQMLTGMTSMKNSAGYVAIERVSGTLSGRKGTFVLMHTGAMNRGAPSLTITVVPDSGTGELTGIAGTFMINIVDGKHFYEFDYTLPGK
jgi:hypothetical protein